MCGYIKDRLVKSDVFRVGKYIKKVNSVRNHGGGHTINALYSFSLPYYQNYHRRHTKISSLCSFV